MGYRPLSSDELEKIDVILNEAEEEFFGVQYALAQLDEKCEKVFPGWKKSSIDRSVIHRPPALSPQVQSAAPTPIQICPQLDPRQVIVNEIEALKADILRVIRDVSAIFRRGVDDPDAPTSHKRRGRIHGETEGPHQLTGAKAKESPISGQSSDRQISSAETDDLKRQIAEATLEQSNLKKYLRRLKRELRQSAKNQVDMRAQLELSERLRPKNYQLKTK